MFCILGTFGSLVMLLSLIYISVLKRIIIFHVMAFYLNELKNTIKRIFDHKMNAVVIKYKYPNELLYLI